MELYHLLGQSDMALVHMEQLKKLLAQQVLERPDLPMEGYSRLTVEIHIRLLMSGVVDAYRDWIAGEIPCTLEELTIEVAKALHMWVNS